MHRRCESFSIRALLLPILAGAALSAQAATVPGLYAAVVPDSDPQQAAQSAMAAVLVRLTGSRDAASDPALAGLLSDARRYVQVERSTTAGSTQVLFDGTALRAAISAAGGSLWGPDRPLVWVVLPQQDPAEVETLRARLQSAAQARGLPITITAGATADDTAGPEALLAAARRAGAGAALLAQAPSDDPGALQWTLVAATADGRWSGGPESAVDGATDALVHAARVLDSAPVAELDCHITGVADLPSFANVLSAVGGVPGVTAVAVREIDADNLTLRLLAHGSQGELARALASERLRAAGTGSAGELEYRYQAGQ